MELSATGQGSAQPPLDRTSKNILPAEGSKREPFVTALDGKTDTNRTKPAEVRQTVSGNQQDKLAGIGSNIDIVA